MCVTCVSGDVRTTNIEILLYFAKVMEIIIIQFMYLHIWYNGELLTPVVEARSWIILVEICTSSSLHRVI